MSNSVKLKQIVHLYYILGLSSLCSLVPLYTLPGEPIAVMPLMISDKASQRNIIFPFVLIEP